MTNKSTVVAAKNDSTGDPSPIGATSTAPYYVADAAAVSVAANVSMTVVFTTSFVAAGGVPMAQRAAGVLAALRCPEGDLTAPTAWQHPLGGSLRRRGHGNDSHVVDLAGLHVTAAVVDVLLWLPLSVLAVGVVNVVLLFGMGVDDLDRSYLASVGGMTSLRGLLFVARVPSCVLLPAVWFLNRALESSATAVSGTGGDDVFTIIVLSTVSLLSLATVLWIVKMTTTMSSTNVKDNSNDRSAGDSFAADLVNVVLPPYASSCLPPKVYSFVMGQTEWVAKTYDVEEPGGGGGTIRVNHPFHRRTAVFYEECLPSRKWFLAVDLATSFLTSAASNVRSRSSTLCLVVQATVLTMAILSLVLTLVLRPYRAPADLGHAVFVGVTTVAAGCLSVVDGTRSYASAVASAALASAAARILLVVSVQFIQRLPAVRSVLRQKVAEMAQAPDRRQPHLSTNAAAPLLVVEPSDGARDDRALAISRRNRIAVIDEEDDDDDDPEPELPATKCDRVRCLLSENAEDTML